MTTFNSDLATSFRVEEREDAVLLKFDEDTLGINPTSGGFSLTPDWNSKHFTLKLSEESILYHLTDETSDDRLGDGDLPPAEFIAEIYLAVRALAPLFPLEELGLSTVGKVDIDKMEEYLERKGVISVNQGSINVNHERKEEFGREYLKNKDVRRIASGLISEPICIEEAKRSEEQIFVTFDKQYFPWVLLMFPDNYVGLCRPWKLLELVTQSTGSRSLSLLNRAMKR